MVAFDVDDAVASYASDADRPGEQGDPEANYKEPLAIDVKDIKGLKWNIVSFVLRSLTMVVSVMPGVADVTTLNGIRMFYPSGDGMPAVPAEGAPEPSAETETSEDETGVSDEDLDQPSAEEQIFVPSAEPPKFVQDAREESSVASSSTDGEPEAEVDEEQRDEEADPISADGDTRLVLRRETDDHTVTPNFVAGGAASSTPHSPPQQRVRNGGRDGFEDATEAVESCEATGTIVESSYMTLQQKNEALAVQVVACRFLLSIYTIDALCMAVGKIMQFEVLWLIEERHACRFNYIVFTLILTLTEITIEFIASSVTPLIYRIATRGAPLTSKRLAIFSLQAYSVSATVSLLIYPPLGFVIHVLGGFDTAASFFFVMIFWGIQYAFMNQVGDAAVEMARPHWFRTFKGLSLTLPGVPFFCCCDRFVHKAWRHKLSKRADSHRDGVLENPGMAHVVREQIHSLQGRAYTCVCTRIVPDAESTSDVARAIHLRHRCNLSAAVTSSSLSVFLVLLKMLMGILTLGPYFAVTQLKTSAVCKQKMLCGLCDKNINIPGVARFFMAFCFSLVTVIFTIVLWINKDRLVEGVVDEKIGEDEDGVGVRVDADEDAAAMNRAAVKRKSCCKKKGAHGAAEDGDGQAGDDSAMGEDGAIPAEAKHDRTWPRMPWNMQCFELSIVAFMVIAFTVPSQALAAFIVMVANRVSSGEDEDTVIIDFDKQLGIPTNGVMNLTSKKLPALATGLMFGVAFAVLIGKVVVGERKRQKDRMNRMFPGKKKAYAAPESRQDATRRERKEKNQRRKRRSERQRIRLQRIGGSETRSRHAAARRLEIEDAYEKERLTLVEDISRYATKPDMEMGKQDKVEEWWLGYGPRCGDVDCCEVLLKEHCPRIWCGDKNSPVERWVLMLAYETISIALATIALFALQGQSGLAIFFTLPLLLPFKALQTAIEVQVQEFLFDYDEELVTDIVFWSNIANVITNAPLLAVNWIAITYRIVHKETHEWPYDYYAPEQVGNPNLVCPDQKWTPFVVNKAMYHCANTTEPGATVPLNMCSCGGDSEMFCKAADKVPRYIEPFGCELLESITELDPSHEALQSAILFGVTIAIFSVAVFFFAKIDPYLPKNCNVHQNVAEWHQKGKAKRIAHRKKQEAEQLAVDKFDREKLRKKLFLEFDDVTGIADDTETLRQRHGSVEVANPASRGYGGGMRMHVGGIHMAVHPTSFSDLRLSHDTL